MTRPITCAIIDDEPPAVRMLEDYVVRTPFLTLTGSFTDSVAAIARLREQPVDVVFLDIQMPDLDGLELSRMLPASTRIIFTTAFREYALEGYEVSALDYLLKPIRYSKFLAAAEKARAWFDMQQRAVQSDTTEKTVAEHIFVRADGELLQIALADIILVEGLKDYVRIRLASTPRPVITHLTMKACEELLPAIGFMRVSRSHIVALSRIKSVDRNNCINIGGELIHVTDSYLEAFRRFVAQRQA